MTTEGPRLPAGTVTFLFTDVEGSTRLLHELGAGEYAQALAEHRRVLRAAFAAHGGVEVDTQGDAFFVAFPTAPGTLEAAADAMEGLVAGPIRVRMGIHTGTPYLADEGYVGVDVHRAARIAACGHGGQVLVSAPTAALVGTDGLRDLGEHRLKDLAAPERIYQLGDDEFPPLKSLHQTNLPIPATPFVGRQYELAEVLRLGSDESIRLLTLTGAGGTGKTRLALQAAGALADRYPQGVWYVPLASLRDPRLVLETAATALGARDGLATHIADKAMLVLFDNFEHVVEAAPELAGLLASCPKLDLLVTSREPLHVTGEQEYPVPPFMHEEAVLFFIARARAVKPDFDAGEAVSEICRRLDELPLALELAAARAKALSSAQILERLDQRLPLLTGGARDLPERQRTLRATIAWSYELLTDDERHLFARLAVFAGGCRLEAAEQVAGADVDTLQSLVDKSLIRHANERFWMLETIREYADELLEASGEAEDLRRVHADHLLAIAQEAASHFDNPSEQQRWLERLDADVANFRAALAWASGGGASDVGLRLAASLREYWFVRGDYSEGLRWLDLLLAGGVAGEPKLRALALQAAAELAMKIDEVPLARRYAEEALAVAREADDAVTMARSLLVLGNEARLRDDAEQQDAFFAEGLALARAAGELVLAGRFVSGFGLAALEAGDFERARRFFRESLSIGEATGSEQGVARALTLLGALALHEGRIEDAVVLERRSLGVAHGLRWMEGVVVLLGFLAYAYAELGQTERAARLVGAESRLVEELHLRLERFVLELRERTATQVRRSLDAERFDHLLAEGRAMSVDEAVETALRDD